MFMLLSLQYLMVLNYSANLHYSLTSMRQHCVTEWSTSTRLMWNVQQTQEGKSLHSQKLPVIPTLFTWDWGSFLGRKSVSVRDIPVTRESNMTLTHSHSVRALWNVSYVAYWPAALGVCDGHEQNLGPEWILFVFNADHEQRSLNVFQQLQTFYCCCSELQHIGFDVTQWLWVYCANIQLSFKSVHIHTQPV